MALGGTYTTGTLTIANGDSVAVFSGSLMTTQAEVGDWLLADGTIALVSAVTDDTHLGLVLPWSGSNQSGAAYVLIKMSWLRYPPAELGDKVRQYLALLDDPTLIYQVSGTEPDIGVGEDGQLAVKINAGTWTFWLKVSGSWVLQGNPLGFTWRGAWSSATGYVVGDVVSRTGSAYISKLVGTNHDPVSSPTYWDVYTVGGTAYDISIWDSGRPSAAELLARHDFSRTVIFASNFSGSVASAGTTATASAVYTIQKNGVSAGTITFGIGAATGTFSGSQVTFVAGDVLSLVAPDPRDATLANVSITLSGTR